MSLKIEGNDVKAEKKPRYLAKLIKDGFWANPKEFTRKPAVSLQTF